VRLTCETCGSGFARRPSGAGPYCSRPCMYKGKIAQARARRTEQEPAPIDGARWIALNRGFALIDADRFEELNTFVWSVYGRDGKHAARCDGRRTTSLHCAVLGTPRSVHIDHINGDGLDCRKGNLRIADNSLNHANIGKMRKVTSSKYKGVHLRRDRDRWSAEVAVRGRRHKLGCYGTEREAALAYDAAAVQHFGEFAKTNFPLETSFS